MGILPLSFDQFPQYNESAAVAVANELNELLKQAAKDSPENIEALNDLRSDMIASPDLYLSDTLIEEIRPHNK